MSSLSSRIILKDLVDTVTLAQELKYGFDGDPLVPDSWLPIELVGFNSYSSFDPVHT